MRTSLLLFTALAVPCLNATGDGSGFRLCDYEHADLPLPQTLLARIVEGIEFAFKIGAARQIGTEDLSHAHLLYDANRAGWRLAEPDALLLHTQEMVSYGAQSLHKRNILLQTGQKPAVLNCGLGKHLRNYFSPEILGDFCTVDHVDLQMDKSGEVMFVPVDGIAVDDLAGALCNVRLVRGRKVLFVLSPYHRGLYADR